MAGQDQVETGGCGRALGRVQLGLLGAFAECRDHDVDVEPERRGRRGVVARRGSRTPRC